LGILPPLRAFAQDEVSAPVEPGEWRPTTCQGCTSWCAAQVYVENGRATKVRGNPRSKVNGVNTCVRSHLSLQEVYDPDRIKVPMKRTNPKKGRNEDPGFVPITWDEALEHIAEKIIELRRNNETHKYVLWRGRYSYLRDIIYKNMTSIIGSPNGISHSAICAEAEKFGPYFTEGEWTYRQYDVLNTHYMLLWGADPIAANRQVSYYSSVWGDVLDAATVAVIDPRLSASASKADEWLSVKPGEDGALAVAMAHTILVEGLWNRQFVGDFVDGRNRFIPGQEVDEAAFEETFAHGLVKWWNIELKDKTVEWAAKVTELPADRIRSVAIGFAQHAPHAISWVGGGPVMQVRGCYNSMAAHALNGLVGSVDNVGGTMVGNKKFMDGWPDYKPFMDEIAKQGVSQKKIDQRGTKAFPALNKGKSGGGVVTNRCADAILAEDPYDVKVAIGYFNNFAFSCPQSDRWHQALAKIPTVVHVTTHASEFTWFADIVLPATHHMYEKWGLCPSMAGGYTHISLNQPLIEPVWDVKIDETEVPWAIGVKLAAKGFPNLRNYLEQIKDPETGATPTNEREFALYALKHTSRVLWDPEKHQGGDSFNGWEDFKAKGVWNSDPYPFRKRWGNMKTKTGRFEFYSETLKSALEGHAQKHGTDVDDIMGTAEYLARGEQAFVPHYEQPKVWGSENEYPLLFVDYKSRLNREGRSANCTWYQDFKDLDPGDERWDDVAKLNPIDGQKLGIASGDRIRIVSPTGELECTAKLWEGARPGTVAKCYGQGHWMYGRVAAASFGENPRGGNNNDILPADYDRLSGSSAFYGVTRVKVVKV
jgi:anaerobic selenocysteine-containing dehydrogenase